eukprot:CAMPEP_0202978914 /NCGR_PEP_ID=MMETSP1396-20130829/85201_1 /ASSEMBLY_ACC=CAM_ASM_000872 /TAXON_ID= /ORGANISM="Pseudokeronopsis sp., Strain Brazil" /LENGTH=62 /DNA_ID=CAMNT_0049718089 /DNA_START=1281 /DNA_END=1469 /DNA_ORIENTATION=-
MRAKKDFLHFQIEQNGQVETDHESHKLDFEEFKEALAKIACLGKGKLGGLVQKEAEEGEEVK